MDIINLFISLFPFLVWIIYSLVSNRLDNVRPSLSHLMNLQRVRWVQNAVHRDNALDGILSSALMNSVAFFASTTVLLVLALFAVFGQLSLLYEALSSIRPEISNKEIIQHLIILLATFIVAFLYFTMSLRQFNHFCIMLGSADHSEEGNEDEVIAIAALNTLGARNFNQGIRAYYFSVAMLVWFISPILSVLITLLILGFLIYRDYFSRAREYIAKIKY